MANTPSLYRVDPSDYARLGTMLVPFLPQSLTILGSLDQHKSSTFNVWSSCSPAHDPPACFALFALSLKSSQGRVFCSPESSPAPPTSDEEGFLVAFLQISIHAAFDILAEHIGTIARRSGLKVGSVHEKWDNCISTLPFVTRWNPCRKVLLPPSAARPFSANIADDKLPPGAHVSLLDDGDLDIVITHSKISPSRKYLQGQMAQSVCVRVPGSDGEVPIAWVLIHSDGCIGALHVVEAFQRRGLGTEMMRRIVAFRLSLIADGTQEDSTGGWNWVDVVVGNEEGEAFYRHMEGWERGWRASWATFNAPA